MPRHGRHVHRRVPDLEGTGAQPDVSTSAQIAGVAVSHPGGRHPHRGRRRRVDRLARRRRRAAGRPAIGGCDPRARMLRPRRNGADGHRREPRARLSIRRRAARRRRRARPKGRRRRGRRPRRAARPRRHGVRRGNPPRRRRRDDPRAPGRHRTARNRPSPVRADGVRRRRRPPRREHAGRPRAEDRVDPELVGDLPRRGGRRLRRTPSARIRAGRVPAGRRRPHRVGHRGVGDAENALAGSSWRGRARAATRRQRRSAAARSSSLRRASGGAGRAPRTRLASVTVGSVPPRP